MGGLSPCWIPARWGAWLGVNCEVFGEVFLRGSPRISDRSSRSSSALKILNRIRCVDIKTSGYGVKSHLQDETQYQGYKERAKAALENSQNTKEQGKRKREAKHL